MSSSALDVCLIGCGPSGMMLLHAIASRKANLDPSSKEYALLPNITCFEKSSSPGGVWRSSDESENDGNGGLYDALWSNGPKEGFEAFDMTFDEFFGKPTQTFLPRRDILQYLLKRNNKYGVLHADNVKYNHTVRNVKFGKDKFTVDVINSEGEQESFKFDRCVWAAGCNGVAYVPKHIRDALDDFDGKVMHSSKVENILENVKNKRICLIGDSSSAEDLALQIIKLGGDQVHVTSRKSSGDATYLDGTLFGKIKLVSGLPIHADGYDIMCQEFYYEPEDEEWVAHEDAEVKVLNNIDVVIFCTGYEENLDFLDEELKPPSYETYKLPCDLKMEENCLPELNYVKPCELLEADDFIINLHNGICLKSNPKIMFLNEGTASPLFELDIQAWVAMRYLCNDMDIPSESEMNKYTRERIKLFMQDPYLRLNLDEAFREAYFCTHSDVIDKLSQERIEQICGHIDETHIKHIAGLMKEANYPVQFGDLNKLNDLGKHYHEIHCKGNVSSRYWAFNNKISWNTFRDFDRYNFSSIFTGSKSIAFEKKWMEMTSDSVIKNN